VVGSNEAEAEGEGGVVDLCYMEHCLSYFSSTLSLFTVLSFGSFCIEAGYYFN
jgi:hypothetical protein